MRWLSAAAVALLSCGLVAEAAAQMGSSMMRNQTRMIERSVSRNLDRVFRPRLVVREGNTGPVTALALSQDERYLLSAVGNNSLRLWDLNVGRELARLPGHDGRVTFVTVSPDVRWAATGSADRTVRLWNLRQIGESRTLSGHQGTITGLAFLDNQRVAAADATGAVKVWRVAGGQPLAALGPHPAGPVKLAAIGGGKFATAGADGVVRLWDASGQALGQAAVGGSVLALAAEGGLVAAGLEDGRAVLADASTGSVTGSIQAHDGPVTGIAFGKGGQVYTGGRDGTVQAWLPADNGKRPLGRHEAAVTFVAGSKDSGFALSASEDGTTRLWNVTTGTPLVTLLSTEEGWAVVDPRGRYEGNQKALNGIEWQGEDAAVGIESYAETHYESALLPRVLQNDSLGEASAIPEGVRYPAKVRFVTPTASGGMGERKVEVEVVAEDDGGSGVSELRLYRNGKLVSAEGADIRREESQDGAPRVVGRFELSLAPGENVLAATAVNADRMESRPQTIVLAADAAAGSRPAIHMLTVGINAYRNKALNLDYAKPDAQALAAFFGSGRPAAAIGQSIALEDGQATKENIMAALARLKQAPAQDLVVVYMAGHGVSVGDDWYYIPHELEQADKPDRLRAQGLSSKELKAALEAMTADRTVLLLDTCHSGTAVSPLKDYRGMKSLRLLARSVGTHILAATDRNQFAIELGKLGHGVFTYALLEGLRGKADAAPADGAVTAAEVIRFVEDEVPRLSQQFADYAQYPTGYSRGIDFPVAQAK